MLLRQLLLLPLPFLCVSAAVPKELQALADQARGLPPEFTADVLLRLAESPLATDAKWKRGLIEDAFISGGWSTSLYPMQGDRMSASGTGQSHRLESLTLQTRAVRDMLPLDPPRALVMFEDIPALSLPKISCQDAVTPDVSAYYQTATALFSGAFGPAQRAKESDVAFLREQISAIHSPSEVVPALKLLDQVELRPQIRTELMAAFAAALDHVHGGGREFSAAEPLLMSAAVPEMHENLLLPAMRTYIVRHVSGPRCSDQIKTGQLPESVTQFNKLISRIDPKGAQFHPITAEEAAPMRDDGTYPAPRASLSPLAMQAKSALMPLLQEGPAGEWTAHYYDALRLIENLLPEEEASQWEFSFMVAVDYRELLNISATGPAHQSALSSALQFLEQQYDLVKERRLWCFEFQLLFGEARLSEANPDQAWLLDQLLHSRNPVIAAYAQMHKLLGSS